jgi:uncharacterized protein YoaH (UPF0181 family)
MREIALDDGIYHLAGRGSAKATALILDTFSQCASGLSRLIGGESEWEKICQVVAGYARLYARKARLDAMKHAKRHGLAKRSGRPPIRDKLEDFASAILDRHEIPAAGDPRLRWLTVWASTRASSERSKNAYRGRARTLRGRPPDNSQAHNIALSIHILVEQGINESQAVALVAQELGRYETRHIAKIYARYSPYLKAGEIPPGALIFD